MRKTFEAEGSIFSPQRKRQPLPGGRDGLFRSFVSVGANKVVPTNKRVGGSSRTGMGTTG